jgi:hypothetical protein
MQMVGRLFILLCLGMLAFGTAAQSLLATQALSFGSFSPGGSSGTVTVGTAGARSAAGGAILIPSGSGQAAVFTVSGSANATYAIELPANGVVALTSGIYSMAVNSFTSSPALTGQIGGGGSQTLRVGATLSVSGNQASGSYSGSFNVTLVYN